MMHLVIFLVFKMNSKLTIWTQNNDDAKSLTNLLNLFSKYFRINHFSQLIIKHLKN